MVAPTRPVQRLEFQPDAPSRVTDCMNQLAALRRGWINFLPGLADDEQEVERPRGLAALFPPPKPGLVMCTWVPAGSDRRGRAPARLGIMHTGGRAAPRLVSLGVPVPDAWAIEQDHPERGLVVRVPDAPEGTVLDWLLRAGAALCGLALTGTWRAEVFMPE